MAHDDPAAPRKDRNSCPYDEAYYFGRFGAVPYDRRHEQWITFFGSVADELIRPLQPRTVLDAGCGSGFLVESFWDRGVAAYGFDVSEYAISQVRPDIKPYCRVASILEPIEGRFDLITCIEVLEHIPSTGAEKAIENLCAASDVVLLSSTPNDFTEETHCNIRPPIAWLESFREHDFWPDILFDARFVSPQAMLLRRGLKPNVEQTMVCFARLIQDRVGAAQFLNETARARADEVRSLQAALELATKERDDARAISRSSQERIDALVRERVQATARATLAERSLRSLVERHEGDRLALQEQIWERSRDLAGTQRKLEAAEAERHILERENEGLKGDLRNLEEAAQSSRKSEALGLARLRQDNARLQEMIRWASPEHRALSRRLEETGRRLSDLAGENVVLQSRVKEEGAELVRLSGELAAITSSPGWRAVLAYRRWLEKSIYANPLIRHIWEPMARILLATTVRDGSIEVPNSPNARPIVTTDRLSNVPAPHSITAATPSKFLLIMSGCPGDAFRYRCEHQAEELRLAGLTVDVSRYEEADLGTALFQYEMFLLHRVPHTAEIEQFIRRAKFNRRPVVFDTDDLVFNPSIIDDIKAVQILPAPERDLYLDGLHRYNRTMSLCSEAIVTTEPLREEVVSCFPELRVHVNRNAASDEMVARAARVMTQREPGVVRIGYFSGTRTHNEDFGVCAGALAEILKRYPQTRLMLVGHIDVPTSLQSSAGQIEIVRLVPWQELPGLIARCDVNLAPLEPNNRFAACKSELKYFEAALVGVPTIASDVAPYRAAITHGENGFLCGTDEEWRAGLERLIVDPDLRLEIGSEARRHALSRYTTRSRSPELVGTLSSIVRSYHDPASNRLSFAFVARAPIAQTGGGYKVIFSLANWLAWKGHEVHIYLEAVAHLAGLSPGEIKEFCQRHFGVSSAEIHVGHSAIRSCDVAVATNWPTAYTVDRLNNAKCKLYLVQDFEPSFYEESDPQHADAEATYGLPLKKVAIGRYLSRLFEERDKLPVPHFNFAIDREVFYRRKTRAPEGPLRILFFARPGLLRRAYPVGAAALKLVARACPEVQIAFYGMEAMDSLPYAYENLGQLSREQVAAEMSKSHIHLSFSLTNISWVPFEAMACGCAVVEAKVPSVELMVEPGRNCLLADPEPKAVADAILRLVHDSKLREEIASNGERLIADFFSDWTKSCQRFEEIVLESFCRPVGQDQGTGRPCATKLIQHPKSITESDFLAEFSPVHPVEAHGRPRSGTHS